MSIDFVRPAEVALVEIAKGLHEFSHRENGKLALAGVAGGLLSFVLASGAPPEAKAAAHRTHGALDAAVTATQLGQTPSHNNEKGFRIGIERTSPTRGVVPVQRRTGPKAGL